MRHFKIAGIFTVMLMITAGPATAEHVIDYSKNPAYLFVISSSSGSMEGDTMTLNGAPSVVYFSDRPARVAGHQTLEKLVESWKNHSDSIKADPPNATLSVLGKDGAENAVVELKSVEQQGGSLIFKAVVLNGSIKGTFEAASLFIDGSYGGGIQIL